MECQRVNRVHDIHAALHSTMAFKRILPLLTLLARIKELDRDPSLDAAACVALTVRHTTDCARHELEGGFAPLPGLAHVADVVEIDTPGGHGHDEGVVYGRCAEDFVGLGVLGGFGAGAGVEESNCVVPGT